MLESEYKDIMIEACYGRNLDDFLYYVYNLKFPYHLVKEFIKYNYEIIHDELVIKAMNDILIKPRLVEYLYTHCACCGCTTKDNPIPIYDYTPLPFWRIEEQLTFIGGN
jgi:hypothetical protein